MKNEFSRWKIMERVIWGKRGNKWLALIATMLVFCAATLAGSCGYYLVKSMYLTFTTDPDARTVSVMEPMDQVKEYLAGHEDLVEDILPYESRRCYGEGNVEGSADAFAQEMRLTGVTENTKIPLKKGRLPDFETKAEVLLPCHFIDQDGKEVSTAQYLGKIFVARFSMYPPQGETAAEPREYDTQSLTVVGLYDEKRIFVERNTVFASVDSVMECQKNRSIHDTQPERSTSSQTIVIAHDAAGRGEVLGLLRAGGFDASQVLWVSVLEIGFIFGASFIFWLISFLMMLKLNHVLCGQILYRQRVQILWLQVLGQPYTETCRCWQDIIWLK